MIQLLWQFGPAIGTVLQYHMTNTLHGTDFEWAAWNAVFLGSMVPVYVAYASCASASNCAGCSGRALDWPCSR
ncbi:MAG: hypothetical protein WDM85_13970 [Caulobacteraceae bacterium]